MLNLIIINLKEDSFGEIIEHTILDYIPSNYDDINSKIIQSVIKYMKNTNLDSEKIVNYKLTNEEYSITSYKVIENKDYIITPSSSNNYPQETLSQFYFDVTLSNLKNTMNHLFSLVYPYFDFVKKPYPAYASVSYNVEADTDDGELDTSSINYNIDNIYLYDYSSAQYSSLASRHFQYVFNLFHQIINNIYDSSYMYYNMDSEKIPIEFTKDDSYTEYFLDLLSKGYNLHYDSINKQIKLIKRLENSSLDELILDRNNFKKGVVLK